jgi:ADP-heptose:LPS heptosyltransferase
MRERVLITRMGAMGDVMMTTPVVARLRHSLGPEAVIDYSTYSAHVFAGNPHISGVNVPAPIEGYTRIINLELAYERRVHLHAVDAFMLEAFGDANWPNKRIILTKERIDHLSHLPWDQVISLHAGVNTTSRTFPRTFWDGVINGILKAGFTPVVLGAGSDHKWRDTPGVVDLTDQLTIHQAATAIDRSLCFVCGDTGLSHVAASTDTPIVSIYTMARADFRIPYRYGILGWNVRSFMPDLDCAGCFKTMWNLRNCDRGDFACVTHKMVPPELVLEAVFSFSGRMPALTHNVWDASKVHVDGRRPRPWQIPTSPPLGEEGPRIESKDMDSIGEGAFPQADPDSAVLPDQVDTQLSLVAPSAKVSAPLSQVNTLTEY